MITLGQTLDLALNLHQGYSDDIGRPHSLHLIRVLGNLVRMHPRASEAERHAALLHSCVEEKKTTLGKLRDLGYPDDVLEMISWNTRPRGPTAPPYLDWIRSFAEQAPAGAMRVKLADIEDNNDPIRTDCLPIEKRDVIEFYNKARDIILAQYSKRFAVDRV